MTAVLIFWTSYVYAHVLSESIESGEALTRDELTRVADRELGIVVAAVVPILALLAGAVGLIAEGTAVWLAIALGLLALTAQPIDTPAPPISDGSEAARSCSSTCSLGLCIVALKVTLVH